MPSADSTTLISTSSGSECRACLRAFTTASAPLANTARTSPFTPFTSSRFPAASLPCQLKSWAVSAATAPTHSAVVSRTVRMAAPLLMRVEAIGVLVLPAVQLRVLTRVSRRVLRRIVRGVFGCVLRGVACGVSGHAARIPVNARIRVGVVIFVVVVVVLVVFVLPIDPIPHLLGTAHLDVALERLQLHARAPRTDLEGLAMLPRRVGERERKAGIDIAIRRRGGYGDVGAFGNGDCNVPVVRPEAVRSAILHGPLVDHVSIDRPGIDAGRLDSRHRHVAVRGF